MRLDMMNLEMDSDSTKPEAPRKSTFLMRLIISYSGVKRCLRWKRLRKPFTSFILPAYN